MRSIIQNQKDYFYANNTKDIDTRIQNLKKLKSVIKNNEEKLLKSLYLDLKKSEFEAYATEVGFVLASLSEFIKKLKRWSKKTKVSAKIHQPFSKNYIVNVPYGVSLIIGPYNYPFQLLIEPLIGAIAAGNTAILKPSEFTPHTSKLIKEMFDEAFDPRFIKVVEGGIQETQELLNQDLDFIFFTGSVRVGSIIGELAGKRLIPCVLELGGKSPTIVHKDANVKHAAKRIIWGKYINNGQTCIAPDYVYVHEDIKEELLFELKTEIIRSFTETPNTSKDYTRIVNGTHFDRLESLIKKDSIYHGGNTNKKDLFIEPTVLQNISWEDSVMKEEIFGPILPVIEYKDIKEVKQKLINENNPLAFYVFTSDKKLSDELLYDVPSGGVCINDTISHITNPKLPFGGMGSSGLGSYHGKQSYITFSHQKSVSKKVTWFDLKLVYPPYKNKVKIVRKIMK